MKKTYLVGGAVRDMLMGQEPKDRDFVVVGATQDEMLAEGFSQVGADFDVYLHPETGDEYALARSERSTGDGYLDFETSVGDEVKTKDGSYVRTVNLDLLQKFLDAGFDLETDYDVEELLQFFRSL
jgi:tRNA nucleotidyltransferase (CCA-adding enzyme)